jgi:predicted amidohydrolase
MKVAPKKEKNLETASLFIERAKLSDAEIIVLPEMFNTPYTKAYINNNAEENQGVTYKFLKEASKGIILIGGSIPEKSGDKVYNTTYAFENGVELGKYRKINLFDVDYDGLSYHESDFITPGNDYTVIETSVGRIGLAICFDLRFPELFKRLEEKNPFLYVVPGAFNNISGPAHYQLLGRARALDSQSYFLLCSPASDNEAEYCPYGHSMVVDPWGKVLSELDDGEGIILQNIEIDYVNEIRNKLPIKKQLIK